MVRVLFAHGFEGSPDGSKPAYMVEELGWEVVAPIMSDLGWTIEQETEVLLRQIDENGPFDIIAGSSMGGLAAANASQLRPNEKFSLLLIAPAFGLDKLWREGAGPDGLAKWKSEGSIQYFHHGFENEITLGWDFFLSAEKMSQPNLNHPTVILHGTEDEVVPIEFSREVAARESMIEALIEIKDGHRMQEAKVLFADAAKILGY
ncbi:MAG: alpha/beta hydrolase [Euryarchaeota archaeon]|nr:alpha/beta hydrolase [Euryarchaeota archaeon]